MIVVVARETDRQTDRGIGHRQRNREREREQEAQCYLVDVFRFRGLTLLAFQQLTLVEIQSDMIPFDWISWPISKTISTIGATSSRPTHDTAHNDARDDDDADDYGDTTTDGQVARLGTKLEQSPSPDPN